MDQILQTPPPVPPAPPAATPGTPVGFIEARGDFISLAFKGGLLEIITLGFYRFWLATDIRRHLWSHTVVDGDSPEYTGRGLELFIGFLIAIAIVAPIYLAYFLLGIEAERFKTFASIPLVLFFYLFFQFAVYRARRYRLTRTVWRGVRFWMGGSGWAYAFRALGCAILVGITIGIFMPWRDAILERYKQRNSHYGDLAGRFEGTGGGLFKRIWWIWVLGIVVVVLLGVLAAVSSAMQNSALQGLVGVLYLASYVAAILVVYPIFRAIQWRWWLQGIRFGSVSVDSSLRASRLIGLYWKVAGWSLLILILFAAYAFLVAFTVVAGGSMSEFSKAGSALAVRVNQNIVLLYALAGVGYLVTLTLSNFILRIYFAHDLWQRLSESITIYNIEATNGVVARGDVSNAIGEGLLGDLNIGGF